MPRANVTGSKNPFFGRTHSPESIEKIRQARRGKALGNQNAKGYRHTKESLRKIAEAARALWRTRYANPQLLNFKPHLPQRRAKGRIREGEWSAAQRQAWRGQSCEWCGSTTHLELDHIVPRYLGGERTQANAQTLCRTCHVFKDTHVDLPLWKSLQAKTGDNTLSKVPYPL
jgi:5-methylcytosine-specific restriction endonuclease McrA